MNVMLRELASLVILLAALWVVYGLVLRQRIPRPSPRQWVVLGLAFLVLLTRG